MAQFQLLPGARGLDFPDGTSVAADRRGRVRVSDEVAAEIRGSAAVRRYDAMVEIAPARFATGRDPAGCPGCTFTPWPWQTSCPRCGSALT